MSDPSITESQQGRHFCSCNSTCSKKSGKRIGCSCRDRGMRCTDLCNCGKKNKKGDIKKACQNGRNIQEETVDHPAQAQLNEQDGWNKMEEDLEGAKKEIEEYLQKLSRDDLQKIIMEMAAQGDGSLDYVRDTLAAANDEMERPLPEGTPSWCVCGVCREMPTLVENVCCGKKKCVTSFSLFKKFCIDRDILTLAIKANSDIRAEEWEFTTNSFRKAEYRQFVLWKYGKLGKGNRRVNPSCVVLLIRENYKSRDGVYMGYKQT